MALTEAVRESLHLRQLLSDLGLGLSAPTPLFEDNTGAIAFTKTHYVISRDCKHIDVRPFWLRDHIGQHRASVSYIPTADQLADIMTKNFPDPAFSRHRDKLMPAVSVR
eukprot:scaffold73237_cov14-Prasinocladus_malaysianus.AAC.1